MLAVHSLFRAGLPGLSVLLVPTASPMLAAQEAGWPQYAGPELDRTTEPAASTTLGKWPEDGPAVTWRVDTPAGFSSFVVTADGSRAATLVTTDGGESCRLLDARTGEVVWTRALDEPDYDGGGDAGARDNRGGDGPRSTPTFVGSGDGLRVLCFDATFAVHCLDGATGETVWTRDLMEQHGGEGIYWQNAASPLVDGGAVFVGGGGEGQSLLALDVDTGDVLWKGFTETVTHATPTAATIHGQRQIVWFVRSGLVSTHPGTGEELWRIEYPFRTSTAASPVVEGDVVYCSAGYGVGAGAFRITRSDEGAWGHELLWRQRNRLMNHWSTPVARDGFLYGMFSFKKYGTGPLKCVELRTGETKWSIEGYGPGNAILVGDHVVALSDSGELVLVAADPDEYREIARADLLRGKCWSSPAFADGAVFVRSTVEGVRVDLAQPRDDDQR